MKQRKLHPTPKTVVYGNWQMLSPEGELMCRTSEKKANWYLSRGLADVVGEKVFRLKFAPNGPGDQYDYQLEEKHTRCVVCGSTHDLSKHHVIPDAYRKHFPLEVKAFSSYDLLLLCEDHHTHYERFAWDLKLMLQEEYAPVSRTAKREAIDRGRAASKAYALIRNWGGTAIPQEKRVALEEFVSQFVPNLEYDTLVTFVKESNRRDTSSPQVDGAKVVQAVMERGELFQFIERWRKHFVTVMNPQFLSENWRVDWKTRELV